MFDLTDDAAMPAGFNQFIAKHGRIDILHNHAGAQVEGNLEQVNLSGFDRSWALNVRSHFLGARLVMLHMRAARRGLCQAWRPGERAMSGLGGYTLQRALYRADGWADRDRGLHAGEGADGSLGLGR